MPCLLTDTDCYSSISILLQKWNHLSVKKKMYYILHLLFYHFFIYICSLVMISGLCCPQFFNSHLLCFIIIQFSFQLISNLHSFLPFSFILLSGLCFCFSYSFQRILNSNSLFYFFITSNLNSKNPPK